MAEKLDRILRIFPSLAVGEFEIAITEISLTKIRFRCYEVVDGVVSADGGTWSPMYRRKGTWEEGPPYVVSNLDDAQIYCDGTMQANGSLFIRYHTLICLPSRQESRGLDNMLNRIYDIAAKLMPESAENFK